MNRALARGLLPPVLGAVSVAGFAPFGLHPLPVVALALWLLWRPEGVRAAFVHGWLFGLGLFGAGVSWVHVSIHVFGHSPLPMAVAVAALLAAFLALFPAAVAALMAYWRRSEAATLLLLFPALWLLAEWLRGHLFTGFPWLSLGYSQIDGPLAALAPLAGVYGVGMAVAALAGSLALLLRRAGRSWPAWGLVLLLPLLGTLLRPVEWTQAEGEPLRASLIQGNIPQDRKWQPEERLATLERYLLMTRNEWHAPDWHAQLVVWPETAIPAFLHEVADSFLVQLRREAAAADSDLLVGIPVLDREDWRYYNAVLHVGPGGGIYYKRHLVPFGEYLPLRRWLGDLLAVMPLPVADFSAGDPRQPPLQVRGVAVGPSVCYEIIFPEEVRQMLPEAGLLVNVSNDAWFGASLGPPQHLEMARMRALETGRPLLRATNTGITAVIDHRGRILGRAPQFEPAVVRETIQPRRGATPYVQLGELPVLALALALVGVALQRGRRA